MYFDRPDTSVPGPQVEAPFSHLTALRGGGSPGQAASIVPYGRWKAARVYAPRYARGGVPVVLEPLPVPGGAFCILPLRSV
ncbi:hypothetical protein GCM10010425_36630 [Streptomyces spororaveus]|uniref:Uncharacterized protein n=1 Tax=Streptomyces spororaveus TaxID=284039 RepID=A0ABQ3TL23_9ACTN|nr:hypothetical protein Sspor_66700 [Streptomyces spororaveus]